MTDILREVEDEIRREKMQGFAKTWGPIALAAVVVSIAAYGGWEFWQAQQRKAAETSAVAYDKALEALQEGKLDEGIAQLDAVAKNAPSGIKALAIMQKGAALAEKGDQKAAAAAYAAAAAATGDPTLKEMALIKAAYAASTFETRAQVDARIAPIIASKDSPYAPLARELSAVMAWSAKDVTAARALYNTLQLDPNAPEGVRLRAQRAIAVIDANADLAETPLPDQPAQGPGGAGGQQITPEMIAQMQAAQQQAQAQAAAQQQAQQRAQAQAAQKAASDEAVLKALEQAKAVAADPAPAGEPK